MMPPRLALIVLLGLTLSACSPPAPPRDEAKGQKEILRQIAEDTAMQKAIENSYEFRQSLLWTTEQAYDVVAGGSPTAGGRWYVLSRNKQGTDTIYRAVHSAKMTAAFISDPDRNRIPELFLGFADGWQAVQLSNPPSPLEASALRRVMETPNAVLKTSLQTVWVETGTQKQNVQIKNQTITISSPIP